MGCRGKEEGGRGGRRRRRRRRRRNRRGTRSEYEEAARSKGVFAFSAIVLPRDKTFTYQLFSSKRSHPRRVNLPLVWYDNPESNVRYSISRDKSAYRSKSQQRIRIEDWYPIFVWFFTGCRHYVSAIRDLRVGMHRNRPRYFFPIIVRLFPTWRH